jgi:coatomer protein complex subunit gamma
VEDVELNIGDYMLGVPLIDFNQAWESVEGQSEAKETFELSVNSLQEAIINLVDMFGMLPVEDSGKITNKTALSHTLYLSGSFIGGVKTLCKCRMVSTGTGITMEVIVRSTQEFVCALLMEAVA